VPPDQSASLWGASRGRDSDADDAIELLKRGLDPRNRSRFNANISPADA
jgi:hypothetical protein